MKQKRVIIDVVSLGTPCEFEEMEKITNILLKKRFVPRVFDFDKINISKKQNHEFAFCKESDRFLHFKKAVESDDSDIIWCSRGGYGSAEILPFLYDMKKPKTKKILIGYSDIVSIATLLQEKWNWKIICAPMLIQIAKNLVSKKSQKTVFDLINGKISELSYDLKLLSKDTRFQTMNISSFVVGGCISVLSGNFATKNQVDWSEKILFLEDEGEDGERLDRYFTQIAFMIRETKKIPKAILLGNFLEANPHGTPKAHNIEIAINRFVQKIVDIPIYRESKNVLGHSKNMMPLILGAETKIINSKKLIQKIDLSFSSKNLKNSK